MFSIYNTLPVVLALSTAFGVLVHDTRLDTLASATLPAVAVASYAAADAGLKLSDPHTRIHRVAVNSQPMIQARGNEDRRHITQNKFGTSTFNSDYSWPSV